MTDEGIEVIQFDAATPQGPWATKGGKFGPLCVHKWGIDYNISHIATGTAVIQGLTRTTAIAVASDIALDPGWNFGNMETWELNKAHLRDSLNKALEKHGESKRV